MQAVKNIVTPEQQAQIDRRNELLRELESMGKNPAVSFKLVEFKHKKTGETQRGINIHGVTTKPMFVYGSQALVLAQIAAELQAYVEENRPVLSWKK